MALKKITIHEHCPEKLSKMLPKGEGRHCTKCDSIVIDFRKMTDAELIKTISSGKYHCGRFTGEQLEKMYYFEETRKERKKYWVAIAASIVAGMFQVSTSYSQTPTTTNTHRLINKSTSIIRDGEEVQVEKPVEKIKEKTNKFVVEVIHGETKKGLKDIQILIEDLEITATTDENGLFIYELPKNVRLDQMITIKVAHSEYKSKWGGYYKAKTIKVRLENILNKTRVVILNRTKYKSGRKHGGWGGLYYM